MAVSQCFAMPHSSDQPAPRLAVGAANAPDAPVAVTRIVSALASTHDTTAADITVCERCGAGMYRMHAVWRCPACRFKTDCCGW
jgi:hypothetical protein